MAHPDGGDAQRRIAFFRTQDAAPVGPDTMVPAGMTPAMQERLAGLARAGVRPGIGDRNLVLFREPGDTGCSLLHIWFKSGYVLPAHSHDCDCLYYVTAGELHIGSRVLRSGDGMFIPAGQTYAYEAGPAGVEVLEFRNATRFDIVLHGGGEARWQRIAETFRARAPIWADETLPPSERTPR